MQVSFRRVALTALIAAVASALLAVVIGPPNQSQAALLEGGDGAQVLIGKDDDNLNNPTIQPPGVPVDQSLSNTDVLAGDSGNDVLIGLLGDDVLRGGPGRDFLVGGTEQFIKPNNDVIFGDGDDDVSIWAPGDGSDAFVGGGGRDAQVFGLIDRDDKNVPTLSGPVERHPTGVPTANVSGSPGFCTLERIEDEDSLDYEFLVRFFVRSTGALAVTVRLSDAEQVFCTSEAGGRITFADLTRDDPQFVEVSPEQVARLNRDVAQSIR